jgi:hypothetical protein
MDTLTATPEDRPGSEENRGGQEAPPFMVSPESLLPTLFTPIARSRLWRPFSDRQRIFAAKMLVVHLNDAIAAWVGDTSVESQSSLITSDRLASAWGQRLRLLSLMRPAIPNDHLLLSAANLIEFSIDQHLTVGRSIRVGNIVISAGTDHREDPFNVRTISAQVNELFTQLIGSRRFLSRGRLLRLASYQIEWLSMTRPPASYRISSVRHSATMSLPQPGTLKERKRAGEDR